MRRRDVFGALICAGVVAVTVSVAGPLSPPAGPVAPTSPPWDVLSRIPVAPDTTPGDADSVFKISSPGSYFVTVDVTGEVGKHGIEIDASNVTLDLNGHTLQGVVGSLDGIRTNAGRDVLGFFNGRIGGWGGDGVNASQSDCVEVVRISAKNNGGRGYALRRWSAARESIAQFNGSHGFDVGEDAVARDIVASDNGGQGFVALHRGRLERIAAQRNVLSGLVGGESLMAISVNASDNQGIGIDAGPRSLIDDSKADNNGSTGILALSGSTVRDSLVTRCGTLGQAAVIVGDSQDRGGLVASVVVQDSVDFGIDVMEGVVVRDCVVDNSGSTGYRGFLSEFIDCVASNNGGLGFLPSGASRLERCTATGNALDGFLLFGGADVRDCTASGNGGNGFQIQGPSTLTRCVARGQFAGRGFNLEFCNGATVVDCEASGNQRGFRVDIASANNTLLRLLARNNTATQYEIAVPANNKVAPIVSDPALAGPLDNLQ